MKINRRTVILLVLVVAVLAVTWRIISARSESSGRGPNIPQVRTDSILHQNVRYELRFTGDAMAVQQANIFSKVNGTLEREFVDIGSTVGQNQILALIDTTELSQTYSQTGATYTNAKLQFGRAKDLFEQNLIARQDLDNAEAAMKVAQANFETARTRLQYAQIRAPFAGTIVKRYLDPGALVTANNSTLFSLMDLSNLKIIVNVLERDIPSITKGKAADITVDAFPGRKFAGRITRSAGAVDLSTRTMAVEIDIPNKDLLLKPGMFANVVITAAEHVNAVTVPTAALLKDDQGQYVYIADGDTARQVRVKLGIEQGMQTEILSGLRGNERLITVGQALVRNGGPIAIQK